jgi:hypothetical protein
MKIEERIAGKQKMSMWNRKALISAGRLKR